MGKLKDIQDIVYITDNTFFIMVLVLLITIILLSIIFYFKFKTKKRKSKKSKEVKYYEILKNLKFTDIKKDIYSFIIHIKYFENELDPDLLKDILKRIEIYKYKKDIPEMENKDKNDMLLLINSLKRRK